MTARGAILSDCGIYRYQLWRTWGPEPPVLFVMLNPSTADAEQDDPTIRRCVGFARSWGAGGIRVVNLYAYRAAKPKVLTTAHGPVGEFPWWTPSRGRVNRNDVEIAAAVEGAGRIIAAWGAWPGPIAHRRAYVFDVLRRHTILPTEALALTKDGHPRHPLYVRGDVEPIPYTVRAAA